MNKKSFSIYLLACFFIFLLLIVTSCKDEILEIEQSNAYSWQKFMNEAEYEQTKKGMNYMDVVKIAGGAGEKLKPGVYEWNDEQLLTRGYRITFKENQLVEKEIVSRKGNSNR